MSETTESETIQLDDDWELEKQLYLKTDDLTNAGRHEKAIASAAEMLRYFPQHEGALYLMSLCYLRMERYGEAENTARELLAAHPGAEAGLDLMGMLCYETGDFRQAADYFEQCVGLNPESPYYRKWLARAWYQGLDRDRAFQRFGYRFRPDYGSQVNKAIAMLHEALRLEPDSEAQFLISLCYEALRIPEKEFEHLKEGILLDPEHINLHVRLACHYMMYGDLGSAQSHCELALMLDPNYSDALTVEQTIDAYRQNAKTYYNAKKQYWKAICRIHPAEADHWRLAAQIQLDYGARPLKELRTYLKLEPSDLEMQVTYGKLLYDDKQYLSAERHFRKLDTDYPGNVHIHSWLDTLSQMNRIKLYSAPVRRWLYRCLIHYPYWILLFVLVAPFYLIGQLFTRRK
ncbi:tetratricopeptide repeat protein [Paenibacillus thiaminolyticus]|uniref:tetratricopeptide repeat protein n=1 Tax=Paenibacillus thiaminolyticus TaxID=49283 RepID=UPI002543BC2A|nr:tetratricopeptide repeat protein [Paenibacillus thiaminolyticus]WII40139.1 tetratricopeptide repeat protein [Paenibacillus thiaminolyticus]